MCGSMASLGGPGSLLEQGEGELSLCQGGQGEVSLEVLGLSLVSFSCANPLPGFQRQGNRPGAQEAENQVLPPRPSLGKPLAPVLCFLH